MSANTEWNDGIDDDDDDEVGDEYYHSRESTLFLLEATPTMLAPILEQASPAPRNATQSSTQAKRSTQRAVEWKGGPAKSKMELCLRSAYAMMKRKVISAPKDSVGVLIFNTAEGKDSKDILHKNCFLLQDLVQPDAKNIRKFKDLLTTIEEDPDYLPNLLAPNSGQNIIADAFGVCNTIFRARAPKMSSKNILFVTDNDDPTGDSLQLTEVAKIKRKDLHSMNFNLTPFFIPPQDDGAFDIEKCYADIITLDGDDDDEADETPLPRVETNLQAALNGMVQSMRTKEATKRSAFAVPLILGEGFVIGVNGYQLVGEEKRKPPVKVDLNTAAGEEVVAKTVWKDSESGEPLDPKTEIKKFYQVGKSDVAAGVESTKIFFEESEIRKIKSLGRAPGITLLGFKPRKEYLKFQETIKHSYFIYPNEETYSGSTRTFASLLQTMLDKDKVGFAVLLARVSGRPQIVIMIPQAEKLNDYGIAILPAGIHLCQLPFADDIRQIGVESTKSVIPPIEPDQDLDEVEIPAVEEAKKIVKHLSKAYNPDSYPNPALNFFYETLAAIALDEELPEPTDSTIPAYAQIDAKVGKHIANLKRLIPEKEVDMSEVKTSNKRRKVEVDPNTPVPDASEFIESFKELGIKLKVDDLKKGLKLLGLSTAGLKADLIQRVTDELVKRGELSPDGDASDDEDAPPKKKKKVKESKKKNPVEPESEEEPPTEDDDEEDYMMVGRPVRQVSDDEDDF